MRRLLRWLGAGVAVVLVGAGIVFALLELPGPELPRPVTLTVGEGKRFGDVAVDAERRGLLRYPRLLTWWARLTRADRAVRWGDYSIHHALSPLELLARLAGPPDPVHLVTIPEGFTVQAALAALESAGFGSAESFRCLLDDPVFLAAHDVPVANPEGYLFPDTYVFPLTTPVERILHAMLERFRDVTGPALAQRAARVGLSLHEAVTLASIVEAETARADERPLVSAVFHNRLRRHMPLQSDPTVLYGTGRPIGDRSITREDLRRATPYNTYVIGGLPPGPIANPGRASLDAAVEPAAVDYLYFVARGDGSHQFSSTLAEHNLAVNRYQRHGR